MFRAIILPIFRSTRLCYSLWYNAATMLPAGGQLATSWVLYTTSCKTQSSAPEDGQNNCPKHAELTGIINKPLLLHLVGCLYYLYQWCTVKQISDNEIYLLIKYIKSILWRVAKCLSYIGEARCLKVKPLSRTTWHANTATKTITAWTPPSVTQTISVSAWCCLPPLTCPVWMLSVRSASLMPENDRKHSEHSLWSVPVTVLTHIYDDNPQSSIFRKIPYTAHA